MFNAFLRVLVNPVDAALFQPPNPTYSRGVRGALVDGVDLVELDPIQGFLAVQTPISDQKTCLVWVHGNACDCGEESRGFLNIATSLKVVVIGVEFPGYGACPGIPNEASVDACTLAAYLYAKAKGFERIILVGRSLGSGPVTRLARKLCFENASEFAGVILWSPIVSVKEQCKNLVGSTVSSLLADRWSPITDLTFISRPVQFITGAFDSLTPPTACARMRQASVEAPYTFLHVSETADHNAGWDFLLDVMDPIRRFVAFVSTHNVFALDDDESSEAEDESDLAIKGDHVLGGDLGDFTKQQGISTVPSLDVKSSEQLDKNIEVLIVGCGPVGLWTAASLVHMGMKAEKILCVDKYAAFQRSHVLRIESASVQGAPESLMRLVKDEIGITRTNAIEEKLATECSKRGVKFMRPKEVVDVKAFHAAFVPSARVVICCDGSHSVGRRQLFGGLEKRFTLEYVLDCRGEIVSPSKPGKLSFTAMVDLLGHIVSWLVPKYLPTTLTDIPLGRHMSEKSR